MTVAIAIQGVTKVFGAKRALDDVSLSVPQGHIFGFLGPNGAGKTTIIRCLMDYIRPTHGHIEILGLDSRIDGPELKRSIGYLSADLQLHLNWSAQEHIDFLASIKGRGHVDKLIHEFDLDTKTKVSNLSSGNKQKLAIILAFMGHPKVLIMDEPTRGLDPLLQNKLYSHLREFAAEGGTVFFSSHDLAEVQQLCNNVAVIRSGKIVAVAAMNDILQLHRHIVRATATKPFKRADFELEGVEIGDMSGERVTLKVRGSIDPVLKSLAKYHLSDLEVSHASLEDIFMEFY